MKNIKSFARGAVYKLFIPVSFLLLLAGCTFDYGDSSSSENTLPDLVMKNVDYIRVRSADPIARFQAELAERYEKQGLMKLQNFSFEQYGDRGIDVNASGHGGNAEVEIESGDIQMTNGVKLEVESEDIILEANSLAWKDEQRIFSTGVEEEVIISRKNGTRFIGIGLSADARRRTYDFSGLVTGTFIQDDDEEEDQEDTVLSGEDG
ncbi:MAG: LPS export ABC transporter periplasmic protein LptC [Treponema sp.]|nr:LPS export ABC transporter periplasmic protein LptC [Treponema sp.]